MFLRTSTPITHRGERKTPQEQKTPLQEQKIIGEQKHHAEKKKHPKYNSGNKITRNRHPSFHRIPTTNY